MKCMLLSKILQQKKTKNKKRTEIFCAFVCTHNSHEFRSCVRCHCTQNKVTFLHHIRFVLDSINIFFIQFQLNAYHFDRLPFTKRINIIKCTKKTRSKKMNALNVMSYAPVGAVRMPLHSARMQEAHNLVHFFSGTRCVWCIQCENFVFVIVANDFL